LLPVTPARRAVATIAFALAAAACGSGDDAGVVGDTAGTDTVETPAAPEREATNDSPDRGSSDDGTALDGSDGAVEAGPDDEAAQEADRDGASIWDDAEFNVEAEPSRPEHDVRDAEAFPDLPTAAFDLASSEQDGWPVPTDALFAGRNMEPRHAEEFELCHYSHEFQTHVEARPLIEFYTALADHHGYNITTDSEERVATDWFDAESVEFPAWYTNGSMFRDGDPVGAGATVTVFDVEHENIRNVRLQVSEFSDC